MKRQGNKPEKSYIELDPGTPVWIQHRQNATWEPVIVVKGEWHRTAKSIQVHQDHAENQIYYNSCQTDRTHERLSKRNQKISLEFQLFPIQSETLFKRIL